MNIKIKNINMNWKNISNKKAPKSEGNSSRETQQILSYFTATIWAVFTVILFAVVALLTTYLILPNISKYYNVLFNEEQQFETFKILITASLSGAVLKSLIKK